MYNILSALHNQMHSNGNQMQGYVCEKNPTWEEPRKILLWSIAGGGGRGGEGVREIGKDRWGNELWKFRGGVWGQRFSMRY